MGRTAELDACADLAAPQLIVRHMCSGQIYIVQLAQLIVQCAVCSLQCAQAELSTKSRWCHQHVLRCSTLITNIFIFSFQRKQLQLVHLLAAIPRAQKTATVQKPHAGGAIPLEVRTTKTESGSRETKTAPKYTSFPLHLDCLSVKTITKR